MYPYGIVVKVDVFARVIDFDITEDGKRMRLGGVHQITNNRAFNHLDSNVISVVKIDSGDSWITDMDNIDCIEIYQVELYNYKDPKSNAARFVIDFYEDKELRDNFVQALVDKLESECKCDG